MPYSPGGAAPGEVDLGERTGTGVRAPLDIPNLPPQSAMGGDLTAPVCVHAETTCGSARELTRSSDTQLRGTGKNVRSSAASSCSWCSGRAAGSTLPLLPLLLPRAAALLLCGVPRDLRAIRAIRAAGGEAPGGKPTSVEGNSPRSRAVGVRWSCGPAAEHRGCARSLR